jgi:hypothetical protein
LAFSAMAERGLAPRVAAAYGRLGVVTHCELPIGLRNIGIVEDYSVN